MFLHLLSYTHEIYHPIKKERERERERGRERERVREILCFTAARSKRKDG